MSETRSPFRETFHQPSIKHQGHPAKKPLRIAIIGVSGYGKFIYDSFLSLVPEGLVRFVAATIINPQEVLETCSTLRGMGCEIFPDYREMLEKFRGGIDLCIIPTGIEWHQPMTCQALECGAHVFVEKPLSGCVADAQKIIDASRRYERRVVVGFHDLCSQPILEAKKRLVEGDAGKIQHISALGVWPRGFSYYRRNGWAGRLHHQGRAVFDSPLNNAFAHLLNLSLFFAGDRIENVAEPRSVHGCLARAYPIESFDTASIRVETITGIRITCSVSHTAKDLVNPHLIITTDDGMVEYRQEQTISHVDAQMRVRWSFPLESLPQVRLTEARRITLGILNETPLVNTAAAALPHAKTIEQLHQSTPIENFPPDRIVESPEKLYVEGLSSALTESFARGSILDLDSSHFRPAPNLPKTRDSFATRADG